MLTKTKAAIVTTLFLSLGAQADTILNVATRAIRIWWIM